MSRFKVIPVLLIMGLLALFIPLAIALAQGSSGTAVIRDSNPNDVSVVLSDQLNISLTGVPPLASNQAFEGWLVTDDGVKTSTGILNVDADGNVNQTFWLLQDADSVTIDLLELNDSGQSGTATLTAAGAQTEVVIAVTAAASTADEPQPIHFGTCGANLGGVDHSLSGVVGGASTTTVDATLASLMDGDHAINLHKSGAEIGTYTSCGNIPAIGPSGENLIGRFDKFAITIEPVPDDDPGASADVAAIHIIPAGAMAHIRHLLYSWAGNPVYTSGFHEGTEKGITVGLREQTWIALVHAKLSASSKTVEDVRLHACHVINIIEGTGDGKGENFDASCGNPGDGFGVLAYAVDSAKHAEFSSGQAPDDAVVVANAAKVVRSSNAVTPDAIQARGLALQAVAATEVIFGQISIQNAVVGLERALSSASDAYISAQDMATYTVTSLEGPGAAEEVRTPAAGDPNVPNMAMGALLVGLVLLLGGAYIYRRSRAIN